MQRVITLLKLFLLLLTVYFLLRISFAFLYFHPASLSFSEIVSVLYWGLRFDFSAIFYTNILFVAFYFLLVPFFNLRSGRMLSVIIFAVINVPFIALNFIDLVYFRYNLRRSTVDLFHVFGDSIHSFGSLFRQYWFVLLIFIFAAILYVMITNRILRQGKNNTTEKWYFKWLVPIVFIGICFVVARGWERRPLIPATSLLHAEPSLQPVVNNSTLNILYSYFRSSTVLERKNYFTDRQLDSIYTIRRQYAHDSSFNKKNVIVFVLESFSADFLTSGPYKAQTPFFDSLMNYSTVCLNAFANGTESVKGMTAILGSLPPFTEEPLFLSAYSAVPFHGIGSILKQQGYNTSFFHGAEYDHFNFAKLSKMIGIDDYYSKDTYRKSGHDDGNWGIYDEYFFPYFGETLSKQHQPFLSVLFNISSHPPFAIPEYQKNKFGVPGQSAQLNSITYVDNCFRLLFDQIKTKDWFTNSIFIFVGDHTLVENIDRKSYLYKAFHIPLFVYDPQQPIQTLITRPIQQLDIVPSILDKLNYSAPFMSFGNSFFRNDTTTRPFAIHRSYEAYQLIDSVGITAYDERSDKALYYYQL